jgi:hypothetical protein
LLALQIWPAEHAVVHVPQFCVVSSGVHVLLQHPWPAAQHVPLQAVWPAPHVRQSVPAELQPLVQVVTVGVGHCPLLLQIAAAVVRPPEQD